MRYLISTAFFFFWVSGVGARPGLVEGSCNDLMSDIDAIMGAHIRGNTLYPQTFSKISVPITLNYLEKPGSATTLNREPVPRELEMLGEAMNKAHKGFGIDYRTEGHADVKVGKAVTAQRLRGLVRSYNRQALLTLSQAAKILGGPIDDVYSRKNGAVLDQIFTDPQYAAVAQRLLKFGEALKTASMHPKVLEEARRYRRTKSDQYKGKENTSCPVVGNSQSLNAAFQEVFSTELSKLAPDLSLEQVGALKVTF